MKTFKEMEAAFYKSVRRELLDGLALCTNGQQRKFKRVHANRGVDLDIEQVVADMPRGKLASAMRVIQRAAESA